MRFMLGLVGLLVVLALVAVLGKKQLQATHEIAVPSAAPEVPAITASGNVREQSQQIQNQVRQQLESAIQARPADAADSP